MTNKPTHIIAILQALFVTFLWSTSWVLIKIGLADIPALTFAGLRYSLALLILLPLFFRARLHHQLPGLNRRRWLTLIFLGIIYYTVTQSAQFVSIQYLPAITANLVLGITPAFVLLLSRFWLAEEALPWQWLGTGVAVTGLFVYFLPVSLPAGATIGLVVAFLGMMANGLSSLLGRAVNRENDASPLFVTTVTMGVGAPLLLLIGLMTEGWPALSVTSWLIILWLAAINTAFAFTLWNHTLRTLTALESNLINNSMSVQIPVFAIIFLGERLTGRQFLGLVIVVAGILLVQLARFWSKQADS